MARSSITVDSYLLLYKRLLQSETIGQGKEGANSHAIISVTARV